MLKIKNDTKLGYLEAEEGDGIDISGRMDHHRGTVQKGMTQTIKCDGGGSIGTMEDNLRIRKLTPKECMKLMGFTEADYNAMRDAGLSDAAIYHCAGDSIVTTVLVGIFAKLLNIDHAKTIDEFVEKEIIVKK